MKQRGLDGRARVSLTRIPRTKTRQDGRPPVAARTHVEGQPTMCERCGAVYERKTWRAGERTLRTDLAGVSWTLCPACAQVADAEYFGRVRVPGPLSPDREDQVRRRIWNVERRARHTQPERRLVRIDRSRDGLEILTTSQKLAHRIARELEKAFGGETHFVWTDREGGLDVTWMPLGPAARSAGKRTAARPGRARHVRSTAR